MCCEMNGGQGNNLLANNTLDPREDSEETASGGCFVGGEQEEEFV